MNNAVIVDCVRTPMARSKKGFFRHIRAEQLSAHLMNKLLERNSNLIPCEIDDIIWGCVQQTKEQGFNHGRNAQLMSKIPLEVPAVTVNRLCGSSMQALHDATRNIQSGAGHIYVVGGTEHMGHVPMDYNVDFHPTLHKYVAKASTNMGLTAELIARQFSISRSMQDTFALRSHQLANQAHQKGKTKNEITAIEAHAPCGRLQSVDFDEVVRADCSIESLSSLPSVFDPNNGTITAGNSSALSDGSSAMLVMSESRAKSLNIEPRAVVIGTAVTACQPALMGLEPVNATLKALKQANLTLKDVDAIEINEAFAAQTLACLAKMNLLESYHDLVNLHGGAIALGHPLGCSGARICTSLINVMENKSGELGVASMCIGMGQGIATVIKKY